jgi:serine/threonine protein kinase
MYYDIYNLPVNMFDIIDELNKFKFNEDLSYLINLIIENKQYLYNNFFCNETLIFKFDIYSLGIVFKKIYEDIKKNINIYDSNLEDLINNMTNLNYEKRLKYNQIRTHDFFKKSLSKGKPMNKKLKLKKTKKK